jgi:error-prone DNA polymerase
LAAPPDAYADLRGMADFLAALTSQYGVDIKTLSAQAHWLADCMHGRARIAITLLHHAHDDRHRDMLESVALDIHSKPKCFS